MSERGNGAAGALDVHEQRSGALVPVPGVVPVILVMALDRPGLDVDRARRGGVEIVARPGVRHPRSAIAGAEIGKAGLGVVIALHPDRRAAGLPGIALPGLAA